LWLVVALLAVPVPGATAPPDAKDAEGTVYRRPLSLEPATLDPARIADIYGRSVAQQIFDGLVQYDHTLTIGPALARHWRASRDGRVWTFELRRGVKFHHGRELTSDDVVFSLTRLLDPRVKSSAAEVFANVKGAPEYRDGRARHVAGLVARDRYTVEIVLEEALAPFVSVLAMGHARIVPRDVVEREGDAFGAHPVGTGPFRFSRWDRGKEIVLAANADYFDGAPKLGGLVFRIFEGGRQDQMYDEFRRRALEDTLIPPAEYRRAVADPGAVYVKRPMFSVRFYGLNVRAKPLSDRRVRRALNHAVNAEAIVGEAFHSRYVTARGILPPGTLGFNPALRGHAYDPARARALLAEAGFPAGRGLAPIPIWSSVKNPGILKEHDMIRTSLAEVGVKAEFQYQTDWPAYFKTVGEGKLPAFLWAWFADAPDPDNFLFLLFHSKSPRNVTGYASPVVDRLVAQARRETDPGRRAGLYRQAEQLVVDDAVVIPIWHYTYERLFQPYVKGIEVSGLGDSHIPFRKVWLEDRR
jgi:peptide/nickel transport system substrate-binding protein/oligopeptide transport system substrate-binding protein